MKRLKFQLKQKFDFLYNGWEFFNLVTTSGKKRFRATKLHLWIKNSVLFTPITITQKSVNFEKKTLLKKIERNFKLWVFFTALFICSKFLQFGDNIGN